MPSAPRHSGYAPSPQAVIEADRRIYWMGDDIARQRVEQARAFIAELKSLSEGGE